MKLNLIAVAATILVATQAITLKNEAAASTYIQDPAATAATAAQPTLSELSAAASERPGAASQTLGPPKEKKSMTDKIVSGVKKVGSFVGDVFDCRSSTK